MSSRQPSPNISSNIRIRQAGVRQTLGHGSCFRGETRHVAFTGHDPLLRRVRKNEHVFRAPIDDGGALALETTRFRDIDNRIRPHQALRDRAPRTAYPGSS